MSLQQGGVFQGLFICKVYLQPHFVQRYCRKSRFPVGEESGNEVEFRLDFKLDSAMARLGYYRIYGCIQDFCVTSFKFYTVALD